MMIFRDWSVWFIDNNFMKMPQLNTKYPSGAARKKESIKAGFYRRISFSCL